jgi:hypothetical protein
MNRPFTNNKGFSFVFISLILIFVGILLEGTITKMIADGGFGKAQSTKTQMYKIEKSINNYHQRKKVTMSGTIRCYIGK